MRRHKILKKGKIFEPWSSHWACLAPSNRRAVAGSSKKQGRRRRRRPRWPKRRQRAAYRTWGSSPRGPLPMATRFATPLASKLWNFNQNLMRITKTNRSSWIAHDLKRPVSCSGDAAGYYFGCSRFGDDGREHFGPSILQNLMEIFSN